MARGCSACRPGEEDTATQRANGDKLRRAEAEAAKRQGLKQARALLRDGRSFEGFEDDPITYLSIGWSGGASGGGAGRGGAASLADEVALGRRLAVAVVEDARKAAARSSSEAQFRAQRNHEAFDAWMARKSFEARLDAAKKDEPDFHRPTPEECSAHYEDWCRKHDARRSSRSLAVA